MRWTISVAGILSLLFSAVFVYTGIRASSGDQSEQAIREALKVQLKSVAADLEDSIGKSRKISDSLAAVEPTKASGISGLFNQVEAPEMLIVGKGKSAKELVSAKFSRTVPVVQAMRKHFKSKKVWNYWEDMDRKPFILLKGEAKGSNYVAIFHLRSIFSRMVKGGAIRPWVALADGRIVHHSEDRHIGQKAGNVRPVALGRQNVSKEHRTEMIAQYIGLDGDEVLGTWVSLPAMKMIVGTEWPSNWWGKKSSSYLTWIAALFFFIGAFLIGYAVTPRPIMVTEAKSELKDLSFEARSFIKKAEREVARAYEFARERDDEAATLESAARDQLEYIKRTKWIFEKTDGFLDEVMECPTEKEVWSILGNYLSDMAWKSPVLVFSYSNATHSLLPQALVDNEKFSESAARYLSNVRILVGDSRNVVGVEQTGAYEMWKERLQKHLPVDDWKLFHLPFASQTGSKGVVLFFMHPDVYDEGEIGRQRELWNLFTHRAAWLYDLKRRLLQSTYGTKRQKQHLAGPTNRIES